MTTAAALAGVALLGGAAYALIRAQQLRDLDEAGPGAADLVPGFNVGNLAELVSPTVAITETTDRNLRAFLMSIRAAEGTAGPDGYRTLFGGRTFGDYADHPRQAQQFTDRAGRTLWTTAAGAFQMLAVSPLPGGGKTRMDTWDRLQRRLALPDFGPESQDRAAIELVDECGALQDARAGRLDAAMNKCRRVWASLPGAGYAQPERTAQFIAAAYVQAGGVIA